MKYPLFSYRDVMVGFMPPQADQSEQTAIRGFSYAINNKEGLMNFSPKDYDLYKVGVFDTESGTIEPCTPVLIVAGTSVYGVGEK